ncbi:MAG TPA: YceI family protein [Chryseosolibacter sp.]|nr:YceI family protein [Chryseosolibacter sp.]
MKILQWKVVIVLAALFALGCEKPPKGDEAKITDKEQASQATGQTFVVDTAESYVQFTGYGVGKNHPGTFKLNYGATAVKNDSISGGSFVINIKSMDMTQEGDDIENKLRPHLLSGDFFDADKFGTATFEITKVLPYELEEDAEKSLVEGANYAISGNLKIKDVSKNITFPARVELEGNTLKADANFDIDRREWQMSYGNDKTLGDKFISETVNIKFHIEAMNDKAATDFSANAEESEEME